MIGSTGTAILMTKNKFLNNKFSLKSISSIHKSQKYLRLYPGRQGAQTAPRARWASGRRRGTQTAPRSWRSPWEDESSSEGQEEERRMRPAGNGAHYCAPQKRGKHCPLWERSANCAREERSAEGKKERSANCAPELEECRLHPREQRRASERSNHRCERNLRHPVMRQLDNGTICI